MKRFLREIDVAAALKHRNIVEFIDRGTHNGVVYLVTGREKAYGRAVLTGTRVLAVRLAPAAASP